MKSIQSNIKKAKKYLDNNHCIAVPTETKLFMDWLQTLTRIVQLRKYLVLKKDH